MYAKRGRFSKMQHIFLLKRLFASLFHKFVTSIHINLFALLSMVCFSTVTCTFAGISQTSRFVTYNQRRIRKPLSNKNNTAKKNDHMQSSTIGSYLQEYEATQIESSDCCSPTPTIRVSSVLQVTPQKSKRKTRERGIKLSHHSKSSDRSTLLKLTLPTRTPSLIGLLSPQQSGLLQERKLLTSQKCIDYKNRKAQQHNQPQQGKIVHELKLTGRTLAQSKEIVQSELMVRDMKSKRSRKTFQKLYQKHKGRQILTLESQPSSADLHSEYSHAEPFHFN